MKKLMRETERRPGEVRTQRGAKSVCEWCLHVYICVCLCVHVCLCRHRNVYLCFEYVHIRWGHASRQSISPDVLQKPNSKSQRASFPARTSPVLNFLNWVCPSCIVF